MVGIEPAPAWLERDWVLGQHGSERGQALAGYAAFVTEGVGQRSIWEGLRHQIFLGSKAFVERFTQGERPLEKMCEVPRTQRRALAQPLERYERAYPASREAMACAFLSGVYGLFQHALYLP